MYTSEVETRSNRPERHFSDVEDSAPKQFPVFEHATKLIGKATRVLLEEEERRKAEWYILNNCNETKKFRE